MMYPLLSKTCSWENIGGAQLQQLQIGKGLRDKGLDVSYVVFDHGQRDVENIDGLTIHKSFPRDDGIPVLRFLYPRVYKIWKALIRADADVYYCRAAGFLPGILALFCRIHKKRFVFGSAHDTDFLPGKLIIPNLRDQSLYFYGIRRAAAIVVQSNHQKQLLAKNFGLKGIIIRNFLYDNNTSVPTCDRETILWVSTIYSWKRPLQFINLAKSFPQERFVMIGGRYTSEPNLFEEVKNRCSQIPNIEFLGFQPLEMTERYFSRCKVFVNTSEHEGFPNTFLQAWRRGVSVITYVDPDGIVAANGLGTVVDSEEGLKQALKNFLEGRQPDPAVIVRYFEVNHSGGVVDQYRDLLEKLCACPAKNSSL